MTTIPHALYTIWLPVAITLLFGLLGFLRGLWREAVVSAAIVIGALIVQQWVTPDRWVGGVQEVMSNADPGWIHFILGVATMLLTVLFAGYLLGTRLVRGRVGASSRSAGALLGLANGSALAGWLLRYAYEGLDRTQAASPLSNDVSAQSFMIWAGWFPVALAVLGALVGLLAPLRRAQTVVAQPSPHTDWSPSAQPLAPATGTQTPPALTTAPNLSAHATPSPYMPASSPANSYSPTNRSLDRSETTVLPITDASRPTPVFDTTSRSAPIAPPRPLESRPAPSIHEQPTEMVPRVGYNAGSKPAEQTSTGTTAQGRSDAQPQLKAESARPSGSLAGSTADSREVRRCVRCGTELPPGAVFCTECGLRVNV